ncbi:MAG: autotransporter-associated beta strand repeat-containing protein [Undibacterium sp.]|uniref:autotransporter-associated beta strand repeat-containing protein n=1 Tax=Undibacterium sp. TaxID=1914977 RepID=UPI00271CC901|nr:autotransporter-associated beta strand repeat-containing protein [Undibacterium sp.]MDO8654667.1 autotransporter-associated beta strand repeat-containing protein [Undibacterium sp.]
MNNNISKLKVYSTLDFLANDYTIGGKPIGITRGILAKQNNGKVAISSRLLLFSSTTLRVYNPSATLNINGEIAAIFNLNKKNATKLTVNTGTKSVAALTGKLTGISALNKAGAGVLVLGGNNDYRGITTVFGGSLKVTSLTALGASKAGTVVDTGAALVLALPEGGSLSEPLTLHNRGTLHVESGALTWSGPINVRDGSFDIDSGASLWVNSKISGIGGFTKFGPGDLYLMQLNTYEGLTILNEGAMYLGNAMSLGSAAKGTVIQGHAVLNLGGYPGAPYELTILSETLEFSDANAMLNYHGHMTWGGSITVDHSSTGTIWGRGTSDSNYYSTLNLTGTLTGAGAIIFSADNFDYYTILSGSLTNTLSGITKIDGGQLYLKKPTDTIAIAGPLEVHGYDQWNAHPSRVSANADGQFGGPSIKMYHGGQLMLNGHRANTNQLFMHGGSVHLGDNGQLSIWKVVADSGSIDPFSEGILYVNVLLNGEIEVIADGSLTVGARIMSDGNAFIKTGSGILELVGAINNASVRVLEGRLRANGSQPYKVQIDSHGVLEGNGVVGDVTSIGGTVRHGGDDLPSTGRLTVGNLDLTDGGVFLKLNGMIAGNEHDQIKVNGNVKLSSATKPKLDVSLGFLPPAGASFVILDNDGMDFIRGTFSELPEGASLVTTGTPAVTLEISYVGGSGNDVVLTRR